MRQPDHVGGTKEEKREIAELLQRLTRTGDREAAAVLSRRYGTYLYRFAYRILMDRETAEDVVQEVFVALLERRVRYTYRDHSHPAAFLLQVTRFIALDAEKTGRRRRKREVAAFVQRGVYTQMSSEKAEERRELEEQVAEFLTRLAPEKRAALALRFWHGATVRETARILSSTRSTVQRWIEDCLDRLRLQLSKRGLLPAVTAVVLHRLLRDVFVPSPSETFHAANEQGIRTAKLPSGKGTPGVSSVAGAISGHRVMATAVVLALVAATSTVTYHAVNKPSRGGENETLVSRAVTPGGEPSALATKGTVRESPNANEQPISSRKASDRHGRRGPAAVSVSDDAVTAPEEIVIAGTVRTSDGTPLEGATVQVRRWPVRYPDDIPAQRSNAEGEYQFTQILEENNYSVKARKQGFVSTWMQRLPYGTTDADIIMYRGGAIRARFLDGDGKPMTPTRVHLLRCTIENEWHPHRSANNAMFESEGDGLFVIRGLRIPPEPLLPGRYRFYVCGERRDDRYPRVSDWSDLVEVPEGMTTDGGEVIARPTASLVGRVISAPTGEPILAATVRVRDSQNRNEMIPDVETQTETNGSFTVEGIPSGRFEVSASAEGFSKVSETFTLVGAIEHEVILKVYPKKTVELDVKVSDSSGAPLAGVYLSMKPRRSRRFSVARTGEDGRASVAAAVSAGILDPTTTEECSLSLWASKEGYRSKRVRVNRELLSQGHFDLTLKRVAVNRALSASETGTIIGRVVDHEGKPLRGIRVFGNGIGARTDARGEYRIDKVIPGEHELNLSSREVLVPALPQEAVVAAAEETRVDFFVPDPKPYRVRITAKDEQGVPLANAKVRVLEGWLGSGAERRRVDPMEYSSDIAPRTEPDGSAYVFFKEPNVDTVQVSVTLQLDHERYRGYTGQEGLQVTAGEVIVVCPRIPKCKEMVLRVAEADTGLPLTEYRYRLSRETESEGGICRTANGEVHRQVDTGKITVAIEKADFLPAQKTITVEEGAIHTVEFLLSRDESD